MVEMGFSNEFIAFTRERGFGYSEFFGEERGGELGRVPEFAGV